MSTPNTEVVRETTVPLTSEYPVARVDLMPAEILERRRFVRARGWMGAAIVGVVGVAGLGWYLAHADSVAAAQELAAEQAVTAQLQAEAAEYAEVPVLLSSVERAQTALSTAMATDIEWYRYLAEIGQTAPESVWFDTISLAAATAATVGADPLAPLDSVAEVTATGRALAYEDVATWLDSLDGISNLDYVLVQDATLDTESGDSPWVDFSTTAKVASEAYSERFAPTTPGAE